MKKTQIIEAGRNIRRNRISFLSVVFIAMLAVTAYLGLDFSAEGVRLSANATYDAERYADVEITSAALFTREDLDAVRGTEGVEDAEGIACVPSRVSDDHNTVDIEVRSVPERISLPHTLEGRMPSAEDECAVDKTLAKKMGYKIGDRVQLAGRSPQTDSLFKTGTYTVTGIFTSAEHLNELILFEPLMLVTRDAFQDQLLPQDRYIRLLVRAKTDEPDRFGQARTDWTDKLAQRLETLGSGWKAISTLSTASHASTRENAKILEKVSFTFSMLFVLIAALVIYSTIGRIVDDESRLVGAQKALGLRNGEIFFKYLLFGTGGALAGALIGVLVAYFIFERIILFFFGTVFMLPEQVVGFKPVLTLIVLAGIAALSLVSVFLACRRTLKSTAVSLMNGTNTVGRRKKKASSGKGALYTRLILRNMLTDWKRVVVSIISIGGCCMLLMIGFSLKYAISRVPEKQYGSIQRFEMEITLDPFANPQSPESARAVLEREGIPFAAAYTAEVPYLANGSLGMLTLTVPDEGEDLSDYFRFTDVRNGAPVGIPDEGVLVSRRFAENYSLKAGDDFLLYDNGMNTHSVRIAGVVENYIGIRAVCSKAYAEESLGVKLAANTLFLKENPKDADALRQELSGTEGFISLASAKKEEALFNGLSFMMNLVILMLGILAVLIACFILLNLVSTYVNEKKNELTIMRINGYTTGETIRYASMECYGITALGILLGLVAGYAFCSFLIRLIEQLSMGFVQEPIWISFAASAVITALISGTIHFFSFRKIRKLKLSDIQK